MAQLGANRLGAGWIRPLIDRNAQSLRALISLSISFAAKDHKVSIWPDGLNVILQVSGYPEVRILA
jgi:hypothetical protein